MSDLVGIIRREDEIKAALSGRRSARAWPVPAYDPSAATPSNRLLMRAVTNYPVNGSSWMRSRW